MEISIQLIKELRIQTGSGFMECKTALQKSNGDMKRAIDYLRTLGLCIANKKILRKTKFGRIFVYKDKNYGFLLEMNSETDFVANNNEFKDLGQKIVTYAGINKIFSLNILNNFFNLQKISLISKVRENIVIRRIQHLTGDYIDSYIHLGKIGVVISGTCLSKSINRYKEYFKNISMHIAASCPLYLSDQDIPKDILQREKSIQETIANKTGKNSHVLKSIVKGRMNKFVNNITLLRQNFILNPKITIGDFLKNNSISINSFVRFQVGECL
ncbi:Elongation factor Ts [Buchnera aphidicola (Cinara piceae)]|uniref:Elongation factor Ts n=1 Tax=Buchnera aphidicola (Cinara piceae) TaxID=1660043 RepID=A0A803GCK1_9GAMM|nr:translation elongation factor Ts [Buchnera aphidicola]VFP88183.1 Elongation factor Ts [Buchnera aphidicola (Cinara piceae)]